MKLFVTGTRGVPNIMGGVETHCEELFPRVAALGVDVTLARRTSYVKDELSEYKGVHLVNIKSPKKKCYEAIVHTFRAINEAKRMGADIIHIHAIGPALLAPYARLRGLKVVFTSHGPDYDRDKWNAGAKLMLKIGERMGVKFANEVIVISQVIKKMYETKYGRMDCHLIYNGVPQPEVCSCSEYFSELGIEEGNYVLGMCRFVPEKNLHHLVSAFILLKKNNPELFDSLHPCKLVLAGDTDFEDDYSRDLKKMARANGVVLTGFVKGKKLHSLLTHAKCYVLPSSHEGLPISLLEAMSYDLPVIVSDIPANLEVGLNQSCYFETGNVEQLKDRLLDVLSKEVYRIKYDMQQYNWDDIAKQVYGVYQLTIK
jgi:glycosyltransferase involved in cell wall biosynthesis